MIGGNFFEKFYKIRFIIFFVRIKLRIMPHALGWPLPRMRRR